MQYVKNVSLNRTRDNSAPRLASLSSVFRGELRPLYPPFSRGLKNRASARAVFQTAAKRGDNNNCSKVSLMSRWVLPLVIVGVSITGCQKQAEEKPNGSKPQSSPSTAA